MSESVGGLSPPVAPIPAGLAWVLRRAFGPVEGAWPCDDPEAALEAARRMDLEPRVGGRVPAEVLKRELGEEAAALLAGTFRRTAAGLVVLQQVCREVAALGAVEGLSLVFLKGMALGLAGTVPLGLRASCDIDVMVPEGEEERFQEALVGRGWREEDVPGSEHQLAPVVHPVGLVVEVHRMVRGVRVGAEGRSATLQDLEAAGLLEPLEGMPGRCFVPADGVLVAHLLVHGLGQHLWAPASYPLLRLIADLCDLGWSGSRWARFMEESYPWIARDVAAGLVEAARGLAEGLAEGMDPEEIWGSGRPEGVLLRHMVLGALDPGYRHALRFKAVSGNVPGSASRMRSILRTAFHAVWLTRGQVDIIYGKPKTSLGYWGWRLWRPFDLVVRSARYTAAWLRHRRRSG